MLGVYLIQAVGHPTHLLSVNPNVYSLTLHECLMLHLKGSQQRKPALTT